VSDLSVFDSVVRRRQAEHLDAGGVSERGLQARIEIRVVELRHERKLVRRVRRVRATNLVLEGAQERVHVQAAAYAEARVHNGAVG